MTKEKCPRCSADLWWIWNRGDSLHCWRCGYEWDESGEKTEENHYIQSTNGDSDE